MSDRKRWMVTWALLFLVLSNQHDGAQAGFHLVMFFVLIIWSAFAKGDDDA